MHPLGQNRYLVPRLGGGTGWEGGGSQVVRINSILGQMLNITDQSLDEAQVPNRRSKFGSAPVLAIVGTGR